MNFQVEIKQSIIPAQIVEYAVVTLPSGKKVCVKPEMVHPGNFQETATVFNSVQLLNLELIEITELVHPYICRKEDWDRYAENPYLEPLDKIIEDARTSKRLIIKLLSKIHSHGGYAGYNYPERAKEILHRITRCTYTVGFNALDIKQLLKHYDLF